MLVAAILVATMLLQFVHKSAKLSARGSVCSGTALVWCKVTMTDKMPVPLGVSHLGQPGDANIDLFSNKKVDTSGSLV